MASFAITTPQLGANNQSVRQATANEAITEGDLIYLDTDGEANIADGTSATKNEVEGMALQDADAGNMCSYVTDGVVQVGNVLTVTDVYVLSTGGQIQLVTDLVSTDYLSVFGAATATDEITISIKNYGVQKA